MRLSINEDGMVRIDLEPDDEQIIVNLGPAEAWCFGGTLANPGTGPMVQVVVTDQAAQAMVDYYPDYLEVQFSPLAANEAGTEARQSDSGAQEPGTS